MYHPSPVPSTSGTTAAADAAVVPALRPPLHRAVLPALAVAISSMLLAGVTAALTLRASSTPSLASAAGEPLPGPGRAPDRDAAVAAPVRIEIPSLGVSAPVDGVGLNDDGTMVVPTDFSRTGWFTGLEAPGQTGTAVIVGHLDSTSGPAVFHRVPSLRPGDDITVLRADGTPVRFRVERTERYDKRRFPTFAVYAPTGGPTLRLITCAGDFDKRRGQYSDNVVVYASAEEAI